MAWCQIWVPLEIHHSEMMRLLTMKTSVGMATCYRMMSTQPNLDMYVEPCGIELPADFHYFPKFLNGDEQRVLLLSALRKLDDFDSPASRRRRKRKHSDSAEPQSLSHLFLPDNYYDFEEVVALIFPFVHVQIKDSIILGTLRWCYHAVQRNHCHNLA